MSRFYACSQWAELAQFLVLIFGIVVCVVGGVLVVIYLVERHVPPARRLPVRKCRFIKE